VTDRFWHTQRGARTIARSLCASLVLFSIPANSAVPLLVLDPGHGGHNEGALAEAVGQHEKRLTLIVAKMVAHELAKGPQRVRVLLTRYRDRYVSLRDRALRANLARADLFVSVHFNACESHARRGFETYVLSPDASSRDAARLAARENEQRAATNQPWDPVAAIVSDLRQRALHGESVRLATAIQAALAAQRPGVPDRGVRQAPFDVLLGLRMPGVLVELGFVDHPVEGLELGQSQVLRQLARGLARGIRSYLAASASRAN